MVFEQDQIIIGPTGATRKQLQFITDNHHPVDDEVKEVIENFKTIFEHRLWLWDEFPLTLPDLIRPDMPLITMKDLFPPPNFDELRQVAMEPNGRPIPLNQEKFDEIRKRGEFRVASANFPGQFHCWRLSVLLQKGNERGLKNLQKTLALALEFLIIFARNRFDGKRFSLRKSARAYVKAGHMFIDMFFGARNLRVIDYESKLRNEKDKYLMADLTVIDDQQSMLLTEFIQYMKQLPGAQEEPPLPYHFTTPRNLPINLILHDSKCREKVYNRLLYLAKHAIDKKHFFEIRQIVLAELNDINEKDQEKVQEIADHSLKELLLPEFFKKLKNDIEINAVMPNLGDALIENYQVNKINESEKKIYHTNLNDDCEELKTSLEKEYPIRSKIKRWMKRQIKTCEDEFHLRNTWRVIDNVLERARKENLTQFAYFFERNVHFEKEVEPMLVKDYQTMKEPTRKYRWRMIIWNPENYIVKKHFQLNKVDKEEIVQTSFNSTPVPRFDTFGQRGKVNYTMEKQTVRTTTTWYPFWRLTNFINRLWVWTWNSMFLFLIYVPLGSSVGIKALFWPTAFYPGYTINPSTGVIHPKIESKTHSFVSRFRALWRHVHKSRARFESTVDTGFLSKNITRHFNRFWNYVVKGVFGSILLIIGNPILCICATIGSLIAGVTAPLWVPIAVASHYLICIFIFDFDSPYKYTRERNRIMVFFDMIIYRIIILGICQTVGSLFAGLIVLPFGSLLLTTFAYIRFGLRSFWDTVMFQLIIKRYGRIPITDSFVARRVSGPGLSRNYVYQITPEQAYIAAENKIQVMELEHFEAQVKHWIDMPYKDFNAFMAPIQKHTGLEGFNVLSKSVLHDQQRHLLKNLEKLITVRKGQLKKVDVDGVLPRIRMDAKDLNQTLGHIAGLLEMHFPKRIFNNLCDVTEETWWDTKNLTFRDWSGLTQQFCADLFSDQFLIPLDDSQEHFKLDVQHVNLSQYMKMLVSGDHLEDLDAVAPVFNSKFKKPLQLLEPHMPVSECMPFLWNEHSHGAGPLWLLKQGQDSGYGLPSLYETARIKMIEIESKVSQENI